MKTNFVDIFLLYCTLCQILTSSLKIPISIRVEIDGDNNVAEYRTNHNDAEADAIKFCEAHGLGDDVVAMLLNEAEQTLSTRNNFGLETLVMKDSRILTVMTRLTSLSKSAPIANTRKVAACCWTKWQGTLHWVVYQGTTLRPGST
jgi:hypothetical protein